MEDSIFTRIIKGEIPAHKVYEDDKVIAFLDISPYTEGHTLVIPKKQVDHLWDLDDETYAYLLATTKKIASRMREVLDCKRVGMVLVGLDVPHAHIHLVPLHAGLEETIKDKIDKPSDEQLSAVAKRLAF